MMMLLMMMYNHFISYYSCVPTIANAATLFLGCVGAELLLGQPLFPGDSGVDQLVEIIKVSIAYSSNNMYVSAMKTCF